MMKQLQFYKYAAGALLLLNLAIMAFFFFTKPPPHKRGSYNFQKRAVDILKLDEQQHATFLQFAKVHNQKMDAVNEQQRMLLKPYFQSIIDTSKITDSERVLNEVQLLERNKIEVTYRHFQEVKSILNTEQQADFEEFMNNALEIILLETKKNPRPPKDF